MEFTCLPIRLPKSYIGKSKDLGRRLMIDYMKNPNPATSPFHRTLHKFGLENWSLSILDYCFSDKELRESENYYISVLSPQYNIRKPKKNSVLLELEVSVKVKEKNPPFGLRKKLTPKQRLLKKMKLLQEAERLEKKKQAEIAKQKEREEKKRISIELKLIKEIQKYREWFSAQKKQKGFFNKKIQRGTKQAITDKNPHDKGTSRKRIKLMREKHKGK